MGNTPCSFLNDRFVLLLLLMLLLHRKQQIENGKRHGPTLPPMGNTQCSLLNASQCSLLNNLFVLLAHTPSLSSQIANWIMFTIRGAITGLRLRLQLGLRPLALCLHDQWV